MITFCACFIFINVIFREHYSLDVAKVGDLNTERKFLNSSCHDKDVNAKFGSGWTRLHLSVMNGNSKACLHLLNNKANVNAETNLGNTPLHFSAQRGNLELTKILLLFASRPYYPNKNLETPIQLANSRGHGQISAICVRFSDFEKGVRNNPITVCPGGI